MNLRRSAFEATRATEVLDAWAQANGIRPGSEVFEVQVTIMRQPSVPLWFADVPDGADPLDLSSRIPLFPTVSGFNWLSAEQLLPLHDAATRLLPLATRLQQELGNAVVMREQLLEVPGADPDDARRFARNSAKDRRIRRSSRALVMLLDVHSQEREAMLADGGVLPVALILLADERGREEVAQDYAWRIDTRAAIRGIPNHRLQTMIDEVGAGGVFSGGMSPERLKEGGLVVLEQEASARNPGRPLDLELFLRRLLMLLRRPRLWDPAVEPLYEWLYLDGREICRAIARKELIRHGGEQAVDAHWDLVEASAVNLLERVHLSCARTTPEEFSGWVRRAAHGKARGMQLLRTVSLDAPVRDGSDRNGIDVLGLVLAKASGDPRPGEVPELLGQLCAAMAEEVGAVVRDLPGMLSADQATALEVWLREPPLIEAGGPDEFVLDLADSATRMLRRQIPGHPVRRGGVERFLAAVLASISGGDIHHASGE